MLWLLEYTPMWQSGGGISFDQGGRWYGAFGGFGGLGVRW
jgi:hypothetical protein